MSGDFLLEITVESVRGAQAAERGGADRIELCAALDTGGLTPPPALLREVCGAVRIPVLAMIRPRDAGYDYSPAEFSAMQRQIEAARAAGAQGVVFGVLRSGDRTVDVARASELVHLAAPMQCTFHRAFDETPDMRRALEDVISTGAHRILTTGGAQSVLEGAAMLGTLLIQAAGRIIIVPGKGIQPRNFAEVRRRVPAREFHSGLGTLLRYGAEDYAAFEAAVRQLRQGGIGEDPATSGS